MGMKLPAELAARLIREDDDRKLSQPPPLDCEEKDFQAAIVALAKHRGWLHYHTHDSRRSPEGFPDLVLVRGSRIIFAELKTEKGVVKPEQQQWIDALWIVAATTGAVSVEVWRPRLWPHILEVLR